MSTAIAAPAWDDEPEDLRIGDRVEWVGDPARVGTIDAATHNRFRVRWDSGPVIDDWGWYFPDEIRHKIPEHPFDPIAF
jgi:hypothetical protein